MSQLEQKESKDKVTLTSKVHNSSVTVYTWGGTVTSWIVNGEEQLFLSSIAKLDKSKAIRGGIPLVFPQFGPGKLKQHGFARVSQWKIKEINNEKSFIILTLSQNEDTLKQWNYKFTLEYKVTLDKLKLITSLKIINNDNKSFEFTALLHTYFKVNIKNTTINGLKSFKFNDKLSDNQNKLIVEDRNDITITSNVDRIYNNTINNDIIINDSTKKVGKKITIKRSNFNDIVLWNPWIDKSKSMSDFDDNGYLSMVCVESGSVSKPVTLDKGLTWIGEQTIELDSDNSQL